VGEGVDRGRVGQRVWVYMAAAGQAAGTAAEFTVVPAERAVALPDEASFNAGATVITTVSGPEKARLATAAGAHHVVNYREGNPADAIRKIAPDGVDIVAAVRDAALPVGEEHGLPLVRFPLDRTADAHRAVEGGTVGKVLVDITSLRRASGWP
jgi:NADPH:quinone reductase-like Zn-dependent oxidoreductase